MKAFVCAFLLLTFFTARSVAQVDTSSAPPPGECGVAEKVLRTGEPAPRREWARAYMPFCGFAAWGDAASAALRRLRQSEDLPLLEVEWRRVTHLHDANLYTAAIEIAADRTASAASRVLALRYLLTLTDPAGDYTYAAMTEPGSAPGSSPVCTRGHAAGNIVRYEGVPLPQDYGVQVKRLAETLLADSSLPQIIRSAALCTEASPVRNRTKLAPAG